MAHVHCPETIKRLNAESALSKQQEVNQAMLAIKDALREIVREINPQIMAARSLRRRKLGVARQLQRQRIFT
jgi:hypothetical protein